MKRMLFYVLLFISSSVFSQFQVKILNLNAKDLVYDENTNKIYVSLSSTNGTNGNSIGIVNPENATLEKTVYIGSEPTILALSDDGKYIYSGFSGSSTVRRYNVTDQTAEIQFPLGSDSFSGPFYAYDIAVMPGKPETIAVSRVVKGSTGFYGTAIYDNGVVRSINTDSKYPNDDSYVIEFLNDSIMYGFNNHSTGFDFNKLLVDNSGVKEIQNTGSLVNSFSVNHFILSKGFNKRAFFDYGFVADINYSSPYIIGQFLDANGRVAIDNIRNLVCFATYNYSGNITFKRYNPDTYLLYDMLDITEVKGDVINIVNCGKGKYAFITSTALVVVTDPTAGVNQLNINKLNVYPNPVADYLIIDNDILIKNIKITDINGRNISDIKTNNKTIDLQNLSKGIYFIQLIDSDNKFYYQKFIKN